jgi:hypothetical protein
MFLDNLVKKTSIIGKGILTTLVLTSSLYLGNCQKNNVSVNTPDTIDTKHIGSVKGIVTIPSVRDNKIVWNGVKGAKVRIIGTSLQNTTTIGGVYSIDSIADGNYEIEASLSRYNQDTVSTVIEKQEKVVADTLKITPVYDPEKIVYGKIFNANGSPAGNQTFGINQINVTGSDNDCGLIEAKTISGTKVRTFITSTDGSYAIQNLTGIYNTIYFTTDQGELLRFIETQSTCLNINNKKGKNSFINLDLEK